MGISDKYLDVDIFDDPKLKGIESKKAKDTSFVTKVLDKEIGLESSKETPIKLFKDKEGSYIFKIPIDLIDEPAFHDRTYINKEAIVKLSESLKKHGQAQPILVRKKENGRFERISGYLRIEAAKLIGWKEIYAFIVDVDDLTALKLMVVENQHRENLTDLDKFNTARYILRKFFNITEEEIKKLYYRIDNKLSGKLKGDLTDEERKLKSSLEEILEELNIGGWSSFGAMLKVFSKLHPKVMEATKKHGWKYLVAKEVNRYADNEKFLNRLIERLKEKDVITPGVVKKTAAKIKEEMAAEGLIETKDSEDIFPYSSILDLKKEFTSLTHKVRKRWEKIPEEKKQIIDAEFTEIERTLSEKLKTIKSLLSEK